MNDFEKFISYLFELGCQPTIISRGKKTEVYYAERVFTFGADRCLVRIEDYKERKVTLLDDYYKGHFYTRGMRE